MEKLRLVGLGQTLTKQCRTCDVCKPEEDFYKDGAGRKSQCKTCQNAYKQTRRKSNKDISRHESFIQKYGITLDQWNQRFADQLGRCKICRAALPERGTMVHTDHCHNHGEVRGILCHHCNTGLGKFKDNPATLRRAAEYIETDTELHYVGQRQSIDDTGNLGVLGRVGAFLQRLIARGRSYTGW